MGTSGYWGHGSWGKSGSKAHAKQLRERGFKGVKIKHLKGKRGYTVSYGKKGKGSKFYKW